jgi:hypothetical protein
MPFLPPPLNLTFQHTRLTSSLLFKCLLCTLLILHWSGWNLMELAILQHLLRLSLVARNQALVHWQYPRYVNMSISLVRILIFHNSRQASRKVSVFPTQIPAPYVFYFPYNDSRPQYPQTPSWSFQPFAPYNRTLPASSFNPPFNVPENVENVPPTTHTVHIPPPHRAARLRNAVSATRGKGKMPLTSQGAKRGAASTDHPEPQQKKQRGRCAGSANYSSEDINALLDILEEQLPLGGKGWKMATADFCKWADENGRPARTAKSLELKLKQVHSYSLDY